MEPKKILKTLNDKEILSCHNIMLVGSVVSLLIRPTNAFAIPVTVFPMFPESDGEMAKQAIKFGAVGGGAASALNGWAEMQKFLSETVQQAKSAGVVGLGGYIASIDIHRLFFGLVIMSPIKRSLYITSGVCSTSSIILETVSFVLPKNGDYTNLSAVLLGVSCGLHNAAERINEFADKTI